MFVILRQLSLKVKPFLPINTCIAKFLLTLPVILIRFSAQKSTQ